jgi:hypothetical protein
LPSRRHPDRRPGEDVDPGQRRAGRRPLHAGAPGPRRDARPGHGGEDEGPDPPHLFVIPIQAAIGGKIIARETVRALRKDVTAKCYGGDASRKRKLLDKRNEGNKRAHGFVNSDIPQEVFIVALNIDS